MIFLVKQTAKTACLSTRGQDSLVFTLFTTSQKALGSNPNVQSTDIGNLEHDAPHLLINAMHLNLMANPSLYYKCIHIHLLINNNSFIH